ncbi:MAG TPA: DoxX family protein [Microlunatus sp.]|nr:DoxX family protein [Microlunatus sp.]
MTRRPRTGTRTRDLGLLLLRVGVGGALFAHGSQKLFGWFGGGGREGTAEFLGSAGFEPPKLNATLAGVGEAGSGLLLAVGLGTGPAAAAATATMATASSVHAPQGFFNTAGGYELPATYALAATALALTGPGRISLDHATRHVLSGRALTWLAYAAAVGGAVYTIWSRQQTLADRDAETDADA